MATNKLNHKIEASAADVINAHEKWVKPELIMLGESRIDGKTVVTYGEGFYKTTNHTTFYGS